MSEPEVLARLAERPADVILADTALTRPDTVGFTRRVLARSPGATLVLFGAEDPRVAAASVAAGARALIRGTDDLVSTVAKAVLLLGLPVRPAGASARTPQPAGTAARSGNVPGRFGSQATGHGRNPAPVVGGDPDVGAQDPLSHERADLYDEAGRRLPAGAVAPVNAGAVPGMAGRGGVPPTVPVQRGDFGDVGEAGLRAGRPNGEPGFAAPGAATRRVMLTERELQVLRGMADGKSNAEIGRELFVSEDTVKTHARRLFRKLGARDRAHAVAAGFRAGLVS